MKTLDIPEEKFREAIRQMMESVDGGCSHCCKTIWECTAQMGLEAYGIAEEEFKKQYPYYDEKEK